MTSLPAPDDLLADTAWLRRLARHLTGDAELAADLQQDVTLLALRQPHAPAGGRSWMATVARNLASSLRRRSALERRTAQARLPREPMPSPDELVAAAELQQRAVAALLALPAAYRDTVLLRFMQGLSLQATAAAMGVPEETVRTRQKRALAMLREQLRPARGDRRGTSALIVALAGWGVAMKVKHVVVAAAVVLLALSGTLALWPGPGALAPRAQPGTHVAVSAEPGEGAAEDAVAAAAAASQRTEVPAPLVAAVPATATLTVRIRWHEDGTPAAGIPVLCRPSEHPGSFATTGADGAVMFVELAPGDYNIGTHDWHTASVTLAAGERATVEHRLARGRAVTGVVVDAAGTPVVGASILVSAAGTAPQFAFPVARSDARGRFDSRGLRNGAMVGARDPRHGTSEFRILLADQGVATAEELVLRLPGDSASLLGRVVDERGQPVGGAWIEVGSQFGPMRTDESGGVWERAPATYGTSASDGSFAFDCLSAGACPVLVYHAGFAPHREVVALGATTPTLLVTLRPGGVLVGTVRDAAGDAVVGSQVELVDCEFPRAGRQDISSDGAFRLADLPAGEIAVDVTAPGFPRHRQTIAFNGGEEQRLDVVLRSGPAIRGRLVDHRDSPLAGWWVSCLGASRRSKTDAEGRFVLFECDAGDNVMVVRAEPGFVPERTRFVDVQPAEPEQTFVVPADSAPSARLHGRCVGPDGAALADARLELSQHDWPITFADEGCGSDGSFTIGPLPPGSYRVFPHHRRFVFASCSAHVSASAMHELGVLRGALPARLVVTLRGDAAACARATVTLVGEPHGPRGTGEGSVRTFVRVFPGRYRIVLHMGDAEQDAGEVELAPGADAACDVAVR
jgi:RNA polymerase sigma-70 factor (ECF subfamily)